MKYEINYNDKTPVYKQIVNSLIEAIDNGEFSEEKKLPTERELSAKFNVARGTIKSAFNEMEKHGKIRKVQGSGTFPIINDKGDEEKFAAELIKELVDNLISLKLSEEQIKRIITKEIWNRLKDNNKVSLGWIDCSVELLDVTAKQISDKCNIKVSTFLVEDVIKNPELITGKFDFMATTLSHYNEIIESISKNMIFMERVILTVSNKTVGEIAKIHKEQKVAILYRSGNFLELVNDNLKRINNITNKKEFNIDTNLNKFINKSHDFNVIIVPPDYDQDEKLLKIVNKYNGKNMIVFEYMLDKGSLIHLEEEAQKFWLNKNRSIN